MWPISFCWELRDGSYSKDIAVTHGATSILKNNSGEFSHVDSFPHVFFFKKKHIKSCDIVVTTSHDAPRTNRKPLAVTCLLNWQCRSVIGPLFDQLMWHTTVFFSQSAFSFFWRGLFFPNIFHGLLSRWICQINQTGEGNAPSEVRGYRHLPPYSLRLAPDDAHYFNLVYFGMGDAPSTKRHNRIWGRKKKERHWRGMKAGAADEQTERRSSERNEANKWRSLRPTEVPRFGRTKRNARQKISCSSCCERKNSRINKDQWDLSVLRKSWDMFNSHQMWLHSGIDLFQWTRRYGPIFSDQGRSRVINITNAK